MGMERAISSYMFFALLSDVMPLQLIYRPACYLNCFTVNRLLYVDDANTRLQVEKQQVAHRDCTFYSTEDQRRPIAIMIRPITVTKLHFHASSTAT